MSVQEIMKDLRVKRGWTQDEVAARTGMTRANISNIELGKNKNIPSEVLKRFADVFGVTSDYLLGKTDNDDRPESEFTKRLELSDQEFIRKFTLELDGKALTEEETLIAIAFLRTTRQMKG